MTDYWVATTGNNANPGTPASPFLTIGYAMGVVAAGDTVHVLSGTYNEQVNLSSGGTSTNPVTLRSESFHGAAIINPSAVASAVSLNAPYLILDGFDISGPAFNVGVFFQSTSGGSIVRHCAIHNIAKGGASTGDGIGSPLSFSGTITADSNWIYDIGDAGFGNNIHGFYMQSNLGGYGTGKITNNIIFNIPSGSGVQLWGDPQGFDVVNNTIFNCPNNEGVVMGATTSHTLANNRILNNIFYGCNYPVATVAGGGTYGTGNLVEFNDDYLCSHGYLLDVSVTQSNNLASTDPKLINYQANGSGDYHLQDTSPCIGAGTATAAPATDYDGLTRPRGGFYDIGAYVHLYTYNTYKIIIEPNLVAALTAKNLLSAVQLIGPDTTMASDAWLTSASADLSSTLSGYVRHAFPTGATDISSGSREVAVKSLVADTRANDPAGKPIIQGEMAVAALGPGQSVALYQYGVEMADFAVQLTRAGMSALIAYILDDDMHGTQWGMWSATGGTPVTATIFVPRVFGSTLILQISESISTALRPWFFIWSLLSRMLVPGSTLYAPAQPSSNDLRALVAQSPQGAWTFVLVNRKATAQNIQVVVPFAPVVSTAMQSYVYSSTAPLLVDTNGFPLVSGSISAVLSRGFTVTLAANSVLILSQQTATTTNLYDVKRPPLQKRR